MNDSSSSDEVMMTGISCSQLRLLHHLEHAEAVEAGHVDVEQQVDVELGVQQLERLHTVVGIRYS